MNKKIFAIAVILLMCASLVLAFDQETITSCGGDSETIIGCTLGDLENSPFGSEVGGIEEDGRNWEDGRLLVIMMCFVIFVLILCLIILYLHNKNKKEN